MTIGAYAIICGVPMSLKHTLEWLDEKGCIDLAVLYQNIKEKYGVDMSKFTDEQFKAYIDRAGVDDEDELYEDVMETINETIRSYEYFQINSENKEYFIKYHAERGYKGLPVGVSLERFKHDALDSNHYPEFSDTPVVIGKLVCVIDRDAMNPVFKIPVCEKEGEHATYIVSDDCSCCS